MNAFRMGSMNLSCTTKQCESTSVTFLAEIISLLVDSRMGISVTTFTLAVGLNPSPNQCELSECTDKPHSTLRSFSRQYHLKFVFLYYKTPECHLCNLSTPHTICL